MLYSVRVCISVYLNHYNGIWGQLAVWIIYLNPAPVGATKPHEEEEEKEAYCMKPYKLHLLQKYHSTVWLLTQHWVCQMFQVQFTRILLGVTKKTEMNIKLWHYQVRHRTLTSSIGKLGTLWNHESEIFTCSAVDHPFWHRPNPHYLCNSSLTLWNNLMSLLCFGKWSQLI